jgi:hypothetical protein
MSRAGNNSKRIDWTRAAIVEIPAPTCPECGSPRWKRQRTMPGGDGSITRLAICAERDCGCPYKIVTEFPEGEISESEL